MARAAHAASAVCITTGTPSGVGPLTAGDRNMVKLEGVGTLGNPCVPA